MTCARCDAPLGLVFTGGDAALYRHRLAGDAATAAKFVAALVEREADAKNATAFKLVDVSKAPALGLRLLSSAGHAADLDGAAGVAELRPTLQCSFRVAPTDQGLVEVPLEPDEVAAARRELEAADAGAVDGDWRLATWML